MHSDLVMRPLLWLLLAAVAVAAQAQAPEVYDAVDEPPEVVGGMAALMAAVEYPEAAQRAGTEGRVVVQFIVDEEGAALDPVAIVSPDSLLSDAAVRAVRSVRFTPGRQGGEAVRVRFAVPVIFRLAEPEPENPRVFGADQVDVKARLVGGLDALQDAVEYPDEARRRGLEGTVIVSFVVDERGWLSDLYAVTSPDSVLTQAAIAALAATTFQPAQLNGRPVKTRFLLPIAFELGGWTGATPKSNDDFLGCREEQPVLIGGLRGLAERVEYPQDARRANVQGRVIVRFTVDERGRVQSPSLELGMPMLNEAAIRAVRQSRFEPARMCGMAVSSEFSVPVSFRLR